MVRIIEQGLIYDDLGIIAMDPKRSYQSGHGLRAAAKNSYSEKFSYIRSTDPF